MSIMTYQSIKKRRCYVTHLRYVHIYNRMGKLGNREWIYERVGIKIMIKSNAFHHSTYLL